MKQFFTSTMVDYHHDENVYRRASKRRRFKVVVYALIGTLVIVAGIVIFDGLGSDTEITTETTNQTLGGAIERVVFEEELFRITADTTWSKINSREATEYHYQSFSDNLVRRDLRVYVNNIPAEFPLTYVLPVEVEGNHLIPLSISPPCKAVVPDKKNRRDQVTNWAGVSFLCDPDSTGYLVGTSHNETGYGTVVTGTLGRNRFFFAYRDLEPEPRFEIFSNLLRTFEAK